MEDRLAHCPALALFWVPIRWRGPEPSSCHHLARLPACGWHVCSVASLCELMCQPCTCRGLMYLSLHQRCHRLLRALAVSFALSELIPLFLLTPDPTIPVRKCASTCPSSLWTFCSVLTQSPGPARTSPLTAVRHWGAPPSFLLQQILLLPQT